LLQIEWVYSILSVARFAATWTYHTVRK